jgi:hypothetical protein
VDEPSLTEFLLARIAEDEAAARGASHHSHLVQDYERDNYGFLWVKTTRVLAECEAKRQIVGLDDSALRRHRSDGDASAIGAGLMRDDVLRALASVYADHPDYREEWRPLDVSG